MRRGCGEAHPSGGQIRHVLVSTQSCSASLRAAGGGTAHLGACPWCAPLWGANRIGTPRPDGAVHPARPQARQSRALQRAGACPWCAPLWGANRIGTPRPDGAMHPARPQAHQSRALQWAAGRRISVARPSGARRSGRGWGRRPRRAIRRM